MPIPFLAAVIYWWRVLRRPIDSRLKWRQTGPFTVLTSAVLVAGLWLDRAPRPLPAGYRWGELAGVLAVLAMAWSLALATRARWIEPLFGGLDRMYLWHKRLAVVGTLLLTPHVLVTGKIPGREDSAIGLALGVASLVGLLALVVVSLPQAVRILRLPYHRWLFTHRLIGLFVAVGVAHGLLLDYVIASSPLLWTVYAAVGAVGTGCYLYEELAMRRRLPQADYTVVDVARPAPDIVELRLAPNGTALTPVPGQFVFLRFGGENAWREHPFSVASTAADGQLRLSVRALGTDTRRLYAELAVGRAATVSGPYGMFDYTLGGREQVWIAGGIGVVPFLGWLHALRPGDAYSVDLFYSAPTEDDAVYLGEVLDGAGRLPFLRVHPVFTSTQNRLTGAGVAEAVPGVADQDVFLCGPVSMVDDLSRDLRRRGVDRDHLHVEQYSLR